jgi:hypothetical protein
MRIELVVGAGAFGLWQALSVKRGQAIGLFCFDLLALSENLEDGGLLDFGLD